MCTYLCFAALLQSPITASDWSKKQCVFLLLHASCFNSCRTVWLTSSVPSNLFHYLGRQFVPVPAAHHCGGRGSRQFSHCCWLLLQAAKVRAGCWPEAGLAWSPFVLPQCPQAPRWLQEHRHRMWSKILNYTAALQLERAWDGALIIAIIFWKWCGFLALQAPGFPWLPA